MDVHPTKNGINRYWPIPIFCNHTFTMYSFKIFRWPHLWGIGWARARLLFSMATRRLPSFRSKFTIRTLELCQVKLPYIYKLWLMSAITMVIRKYGNSPTLRKQHEQKPGGPVFFACQSLGTAKFDQKLVSCFCTSSKINVARVVCPLGLPTPI